jgi:2-keto-4-pentenoate hydratase
LTSAAVQRQVGVEEPDFGVLLDDMDVSGSGPVPTERLLQPRAEAEIAFVLARDIDHDVEDTAALRSCIEYASAAIEIVDSRIADWDIAITDTIADNASGGLFALGVDRVGLEAIEPRAVTMKMFRNGALASYGDGSACLGDPLEAVLWLARTALRYGDPLRRGQVVLSGALGPLVPVGFGTHLRAELSGLGSVELKFANAEAA